MRRSNRIALKSGTNETKGKQLLDKEKASKQTEGLLSETGSETGPIVSEFDTVSADAACVNVHDTESEDVSEFVDAIIQDIVSSELNESCEVASAGVSEKDTNECKIPSDNVSEETDLSITEDCVSEDCVNYRDVSVNVDSDDFDDSNSVTENAPEEADTSIQELSCSTDSKSIESVDIDYNKYEYKNDTATESDISVKYVDELPVLNDWEETHNEPDIDDLLSQIDIELFQDQLSQSADHIDITEHPIYVCQDILEFWNYPNSALTLNTISRRNSIGSSVDSGLDILSRVGSMPGDPWDMHVMRPSPFSGTSAESCISWLRKLNTYFKLMKIDSLDAKKQTFALLLIGSADNWMSRSNFEGKTWEEVEKAFKAQFTPSEWVGQQDLLSRQQGPYESVETYIEAVLSLGNRISADTTMLKQAIVQGLDKDLRAFVISQSPKDLEDVIKYAKLGETAYKLGKPRLPSEVQTSTEVAKLMETQQALTDLVQQMKTSMEAKTKPRVGEVTVRPSPAYSSGELATGENQTPVATRTFEQFDYQPPVDHVVQTGSVGQGAYGGQYNMGPTVYAPPEFQRGAQASVPAYQYRSAPPYNNAPANVEVCYQCGRAGHFRRDCWFNPNNQGPVNRPNPQMRSGGPQPFCPQQSGPSYGLYRSRGMGRNNGPQGNRVHFNGPQGQSGGRYNYRPTKNLN